MALRPDDFLIGELSTRSGVSVETLRYYERVGLMPPPPRTEGGRRVYDIGHLKRAIFVRRARSLGFSLNQIRDLLGVSPNGDLSCAEVKALTEMHIAVIGRKVTELRKLEQILSDLVAACGGRARSGCPVLEALGDCGCGGVAQTGTHLSVGPDRPA